jgi:hypothetical protein
MQSLGYLWVLVATLCYLGLPWATLGYLGLPWATFGVLGLLSAFLGVLGCPWASLGVLGLPWASLGYLEYFYYVSHQHCPSTWTPILGLIIATCFRYIVWRTAPHLLRSNFPRSAFCATLDSYNLIKSIFCLVPGFFFRIPDKKSIFLKNNCFLKNPKIKNLLCKVDLVNRSC